MQIITIHGCINLNTRESILTRTHKTNIQKRGDKAVPHRCREPSKHTVYTFITASVFLTHSCKQPQGSDSSRVSIGYIQQKGEKHTCIFHFSYGTRLSTLLWARVPQENEEYVLQMALGCSRVTVSFPATEKLVMDSSVSRETFTTGPKFQYYFADRVILLLWT